MNVTDYEIAHQTGVCAATQRALQPGEQFYAVLFETMDGFERRDYSLASWQTPPDGYFCFWKTRVPKKEDKPQRFIDTASIADLFVRLAEHKEEVKQHFRFVLGLILMRKRLLTYERTLRSEAGEFWRMRLVRDQSTHDVLNPQMTEEQIEAVGRELGALLHGDSQAYAKLKAQPSGPDRDAQSQEAGSHIE